MDINYYSPKRKLDHTSLLSFEGVLQNDIYEIVLEAEKLETMFRMKENLRFLSGKSAVLYTDKPHSFIRVGFECAAHLLDCHSVVIPVEKGGKEDIEDLIREIKLSKNPQVVAEFFDADLSDEITPLLSDASRSFIDARADGNVLFALAVILTIKKHFKKLSELKVAVVEGKKFSSVAIALAKSQTALKIYGKELDEASNHLEYLSQFTPVKRADSVKDILTDTDVIVFLSDDAAVLSALLAQKDSKTKVVLSPYSPLFKLLEEAKEHAFSYDAAINCTSVFSAVLSLLALR